MGGRPHFVADVQDAANGRAQLAAGAAVFGSLLACEALSAAKALVDHQPGQAFVSDGTIPPRPDGEIAIDSEHYALTPTSMVLTQLSADDAPPDPPTGIGK